MEKKELVDWLHEKISSMDPETERLFTGISIDGSSDREDRDVAIEDTLNSLSMEELTHFKEAMEGKYGPISISGWGYTTVNDEVFHDVSERIEEKGEER